MNHSQQGTCAPPQSTIHLFKPETFDQSHKSYVKKT
jgi:hypothetical protein